MSVHPSRQAYVEEPEEDAGIEISNIPSDRNYVLPGASGQQASDVLNEFARKRRAAQIAVPTDDQRVRAELRSRGEPITLFGERREDRRDRLRALMLREIEGGNEDEEMRDVSATPAAEEEDDVEEEFYTEGSDALLEARRRMATFSLPRAQKRTAFQREESKIDVKTHVRHRKEVKDKLSQYELYGSQIASERPVSMVRFAPDGHTVACGDWSGSVKLLSVPNLETVKTLRGHNGIVGGISWRPGLTDTHNDGDRGQVSLATSGGEGDIHLWNLAQDTPSATLSGHTSRVVRTEFHPSGNYLASASFDTTWRLWDVDTTTELLLQEGHSREVFALAFHPDGSLITTAGLDSIGHVWDMRTGRTVMLLESHVQPIHAVDWSPDGVRCVTGSSDGFAKVWDLRNVRETASIGAHRGGVSDVRWFKGSDGPLSATHVDQQNGLNGGHEMHVDQSNDSSQTLQPKKSGTFLLTAGFDKAVNVFSADDWALCKSLTGHDGTVLAADMTTDAKWLASGGRDRTVKLWARPSEEGI
ncbi:U4/U6 small nuclear ribonucleoprotein Prp4 [Polychaeton citri CBS 116435]|uniref:U4/U6 small nuclear ribonucleoprotein Prp4 n=1 Tax=Polychaeton citri CBS 116435 TaxID=1314669 RepID=A0A9P4Q299_9PEZI|nr:U4/U6 small nuclear ribonucleoprotein Prp4 [Polychaeton citri CBS 116435]